MHTEDNISVEKALKTGEHLLLAAPMYMGLGAIIGSIYLWTLEPANYLLAALGTLLLLVLPVIYRSVAVTFWRIWAFKRVRNVNELKEQALKEHMLFREGSFLERIEFRTAYQKEILLALEDKLRLKDDLDYKDIYPVSLAIGFSRTKLGMGLLYTLAFSVSGAWVLYQCNLWGLALLALGLFFGWQESRKVRRGGEQLRFDNKGLFTAESGFIPWVRISDIYVETTGGKHESSSLVFIWSDEDIASQLMDHSGPDSVYAMMEKLNELSPGELEKLSAETDDGEDYDPEEDEELDSEDNLYHHESVDIDDLDIDASELKKIVKVYRTRYWQGLPKNP